VVSGYVAKHGGTERSKAHKWRKILVLYAVCWTVGIGLLTHMWGGEVSADVQYDSYVVKSGDTLWSIACRVQPDEDPRYVAKQIEEVNHLKSPDLVPGQTLLVPPSK
jgi:nucleoid-associated protein YgaU